MQPLAHTAGLHQFIRFARAEGVVLTPAFDAALIDAVERGAGPEYVPAHILIDGLQICALNAGRRDLGAASAVWADLADYGPLSRLTGHCLSVRDAIENGLRYMHLANGALATVVEEDGDEVAIQRMCVIAGRQGCTQFMESVLMVAVRAMRVILGERWAPLRIEFAHSPPGDPGTHSRLFRCPLRFEADRYAVVVARADMSRQVPAADPQTRASVDAALRAADQHWDHDFHDVAHRAVARSLALGTPTVASVAESLAMSTRTLQRRLGLAGLSFGEVLEDVRRNLAEDYLRATERPSLTGLAHRLGFSDASSTSRFLRQSLGRGVYAR